MHREARKRHWGENKTKQTETLLQWKQYWWGFRRPRPPALLLTHRPQAIIPPLPFTVSFFRKTALAKLLIKVCFNSKSMTFGSEMDLRIKPNTGQGVGERHFGSCFPYLYPNSLVVSLMGQSRGKECSKFWFLSALVPTGPIPAPKTALMVDHHSQLQGNRMRG